MISKTEQFAESSLKRPPSTLSVLLVDSYPIIRCGLCVGLEPELTGATIRGAGDSKTALAFAHSFRPDLVVMSMEHLDGDPLELLKGLLEASAAANIVCYTRLRQEDLFRRAVQLGAKGYVMLDSPESELMRAIVTVSLGEYYFSPLFSGSLASPHRARERQLDSFAFDASRLTPAEERILDLIGEDLSSKQIAARLGISPKTVENHRSSISSKLNLRGSHSLVKFALKRQARDALGDACCGKNRGAAREQ